MKLRLRTTASFSKLSILLLFLSPLFATAQDWRHRLDNNTQPNFFQIQADFNRYWQGKKPEKGSGWKAFKRWEWYWEQRVNADGSFPAADANAKALEAWLASHPTAAEERDGSTQWTSLGPNSSDGGYRGTGRVNCLAVDPQNHSVLWAGTPGGGLWKSETGGDSWIAKTDKHPTLGVSAIVINPYDTKIMYIATGDGDGGDTFSTGVWQSTDGGETWKPTSLQWSANQQRNIRAMVMHPTNPLRIACAANDGIYYTSNGGQSWARTMISGQVSDLEINPGNPEVMYACTNGNIHRSLNGGQSWQNVLTISGVARIALCVSPANPQWVGALCSKSSNNGFHSFWASENDGQSFAQLSNDPNLLGWSNSGSDNSGQGWYDLCVAASPFDANEIYTGGVNIWKSTDGGRSWTAATHWYRLDGVPEVHADHHNLLFGPDGALYNCNDGGIYRTEDSGAFFGNLTGDLTNSQIYRIGASQQNEAVIAGLQDNGTKLKDASGDWSDVLGGDGMECIIDPTNPNLMYGSLYYGAISRSTNGGRDWDRISRDLPDSVGAWITPYILNPKNPNEIWAGYQDVYRSQDQGNSWEKVSIDLRGGTLQHLAMSGADTTRLYAATTGSIWRSDNGGKNWVSISNGLPFGTISRVAVHPENALEVYITVSGYQPDTKVVRSKDGGQTWENFSGSLPNVPANCLAFHQNGKNGLYVGTDLGVFYRDSTTEDWVRYNDGLPNTPITDLEIRTASNELVAATYGRGLWMAKTVDSDNIICPGLSGLTVASTTFTSANFHWDSIAAWGYQFRLRPVGTSTWILGPTLTQVRGSQSSLMPGTEYEVQVRAQCQGKDGDWGPSTVFSTQKMEGLYCPSFGSAKLQWIDSIAIANVYNASGNNFGYSYFTDTVRVTAGETYPITVVSKSLGSPTTMFWRAWLDVNFDQDFEDAGELVFQRATADPAMFSRTITIPASMAAGPTRFRISMATGTSSTPCVVTAQTRDVEDYVLYVKQAVPVATKNPDQSLSFEVRPNPAEDFVRLLLPSTSGPLHWGLMGADGRICSPMQTVASGKREVTIPVGHLPAGLYWIQLQDEQGKSGQQRFIKQ